MKKLLFLFIALTHSLWMTAQINLPKDVNFIALTAVSLAKKPINDSLFLNPEDQKKLHDFYEKYGAVTLPAVLKNELYVDLNCKNPIGVCLNVSQHSQLTIKMKLKNKNDSSERTIVIDDLVNKLAGLDVKGNYWKSRVTEKDIDAAFNIVKGKTLEPKIQALKKAIYPGKPEVSTPKGIRETLDELHTEYPKFITGDEGKSLSKESKKVIEKIIVNDFLFINLSEFLIRFYTEPINNEMSCCPENYRLNARKEAIEKICGVMSVKKGLEIQVFGIDTGKEKYTPYFNAETGTVPGNKANKSTTDSVPQIDPRKYLVIEEHKKRKNDIDTIWNNFIQNKNIIDSRSDVVIRFKQDQLKDEIFFRGNISLMAQINDSDPIEIPPYSVIGESFSTVGTKSLSPSDFALSFVSEMMNIYKVTKDSRFTSIDSLLKSKYFNSNLINWLDNANRSSDLVTFITNHLNTRVSDNAKLPNEKVKLYESDKVVLQQKYRSVYKELKLDKKLTWYVKEIYDDVESKKNTVPDTLHADAESLSVFLKSIVDNRKSPDFFLSKNDSIAIGFQLDQFFKSLNKIDLLTGYYREMNSDKSITITDFKEQITQLSKASKASTSVANFIESDYIPAIDFAIRQLKIRKDYFKLFILRDEPTLFAMLSEIHRDSLFLAHALESIEDNYSKLVSVRTDLGTLRNLFSGSDAISASARSRTEEFISQFAIQMTRFTRTMLDLRDVEQSEFEEARRNYLASHRDYSRIENTHEFANEWANELALKAARQLYKKLIIGKIDLTKRSLNDDSKLTIYVLWYDEPGKPPKKLQVASFRLRKLGWNEQIADSFLLINRLTDPGITLSGATLSTPTSRFKGAPGASLMWTYTVGDDGDFIQRLQPSIGINVSYLDFDPTQSFEVGVGAMIGFWKNKVFIGYGRNLHVTESSTYFSIGFSFAKIAENWNSRQSSNQSTP